MFVIDFLSAFLITGALTIVFAATLPRSAAPLWRELHSGHWLFLLAFWLAGGWLVTWGPLVTKTHWLPFLVAAAAVASIAIALLLFSPFRARVHRGMRIPTTGARTATIYFCLTLLLLFCSISIRYYLVHLA